MFLNIGIKRLPIMIITVVIIAGVSDGQIYWKKIYNGAKYNGAQAITRTTDGNFLVMGGTNANGLNILKITASGDTLWTKQMSFYFTYNPSKIVPLSDGNFIITGSIWSNLNVSWDIHLLKISSDGDSLWAKTYGGTYNDWPYGITPTSDGNFIIVGETGPGNGRIYILKITTSGDTLWTKTYGGDYYDVASDIAAAPGGNFIVAASTMSFGNGGWDIYLLRITSSGDTVWTKTYGGSDHDMVSAIAATPDGNFIVAGQFASFGKGNGDFYFLKITPNGDTIWTKTYGGIDQDWPSAITSTLDGGFIVAAETCNINSYVHNYYLLKLNSKGDTLWTIHLGEGGASAITPTSDGNFIVAGWKTITGQSGSAVYLFSLIDDRYAYKNTLFTFKIPVYDTDSLNHGYTPLKVPSGMTVSLGGTISWTPTTDSSYMDHVEFLVSDDIGKKDTLTFNIFVNSKDHPSKVINPALSLSRQSHQSGISIFAFPSYITFTVPMTSGKLAIYDIHGRLIQNLSFKNNTAIWRGKVSAGRYFAKMTDGKRDLVKPFMVIR